MKILPLALLLCGGLRAAPIPTAPGAPGIDFSWQTSQKQGIGTAYEASRSRVWFTIAKGILTETFYPRIDIPQTRDTQFLVSDGKTFFHEESNAMEHTVRREPGAPLYHLTSRDPGRRYVIHKDVWADPDSDTIVQKVRIERYTDGLNFYLLHKPAAAGTLFNDSAESDPFLAGEANGERSAWQGLHASIPFRKRSVGYTGHSDGYADVATHYKMEWQYATAENGNVALTGELDIPPVAGVTEFTVLLFFAPTREAALERYRSIGALDIAASRTRFLSGWKGYLDSLSLPLSDTASAERRKLVESSVLVLKSSEDKTYPGSVVASLSNPWGEKEVEHASGPHLPVGSYHVVWPRDVYHTANGFLAVGDTATATAILRRLKGVQFGPDDGVWELGPRRHAKAGSFPQNFWANGRPLWGGYQADETAMPVILAYRLWKRAAVELGDFYPMVRTAAAFLSEMGPWTQNERWEEAYGISPNSAAYVIAAMVAASEMAAASGDKDLGAKWLAQADRWATKSGDDIDSWTFTTNGRIATGKYYLRLGGSECDREHGGSPIWDAVWNPNRDGFIALANFSGDDRFRHETEIVDAGFLALVRLGVRSAKNYFVRESLPETDSMLRSDTARGAGWHRYRYDGYGEDRKGRLWPLLTGERLHYELEWLKENDDGNLAGSLEARVKGLEAFASDQQLFSEQVWDEGAAAGRPTGSACPLSWGHAEYLELLRSIKDRAIFEELPSVRARYGF
jgi:glucoamylase